MMTQGLRVAFRVDASQAMGTGHVRRCQSLAQALHKFAAHTHFICRRHDDLSSHLMIKHEGTHWLADSADSNLDVDATTTTPHSSWGLVSWQVDADQTIDALTKIQADWLVVDHYAWDARWHKRVANAAKIRILVIDDLADRSLAANMLLDQNLDQNHATKYRGCIDLTSNVNRVRLMAGPQYALLSEQYGQAPRYEFSNVVNRIGIFMGGTDPDDLSSQVLMACRELANFKGEVTLVSSLRNPYFERHIALAAKWPRTRVVYDLPDLSHFFASHDLQIGTGGGAAWERCCIGAPTLAVVAAVNQLAVLPQLAALGAVQLIDLTQTEYSLKAFGQAIVDLVAKPEARLLLSQKSSRLVDGQGSSRVAAVLALFTSADLTLRPAAIDDEQLLMDWFNESQARHNALNTDLISAQSHGVWLRSKLADAQSCQLYIAEAKNALPIGMIRFDREILAGENLPSEVWWISYSLDITFRGLGLARELIQLGLIQLANKKLHAYTVKALVKTNNTASLKTFKNLSFARSTIAHQGRTVFCFQKVLGTI